MSVPKHRAGAKSSLLPNIESSRGSQIGRQANQRDSSFLENSEVMDYYKRSIQRSNGAIYIPMELDPSHPG